jgi:predicted Zn-dependent peptidase
MFSGALSHPVAGTIASVSRIRSADVARFMRTRLTHPNTVLAVVGGVSAARARAAVRRHFRAGAPGAVTPVPPVRRGGGGSLRLHDRDSSQAYLTLLMPVRPQPRVLLATGVAVDIVGADPDSRLFQELRERLGLSYEVGAHIEWGPDWACAVVAASGGRSRAERLVRAVEATCERAASEGFSADELDRARKKLRYRYAILADSRLDQAVALAESALWGFPTPDETERIVARLSRREIEAAWGAAVAARRVRAVLT